MDDAFVNEFRKYCAATNEELEQIRGAFQRKQIPAGRYLVRPGQISDHFVFIEQGCLRVYWKRDQGELTGWFAFEEEFFCQLSSFLTHEPSLFGVQAIEDTEIFYITRAEMEKLFALLPVFETFVRKFWEHIIVSLVQNIVSFQSETAEKRYERAMHHPKLLQRVPLKFLSSYLGVTPSSLSRLRRAQ